MYIYYAVLLLYIIINNFYYVMLFFLQKREKKINITTISFYKNILILSIVFNKLLVNISFVNELSKNIYLFASLFPST